MRFVYIDSRWLGKEFVSFQHANFVFYWEFKFVLQKKNLAGLPRQMISVFDRLQTLTCIIYISQTGFSLI